MADTKTPPVPTATTPPEGGSGGGGGAEGGGGGSGGGRGPGPAKKDNKFAGIQFVIEFASAHNNKTLCPITRREYRGRWVGSNVKNRVPDDNFSRMPDLPGIRIAFDGTNRRVEILDPLELAEYRDILKDAQDVLRSYPGWGDEPEERDSRTDQTDDELKEWAYWARRWIDNQQAEAIGGSRVPEMDAIMSLPGRVRYNQFDMSGKKESYPDMREIPNYRPPVPPKKRRLKRSRRDRED
jgi:hypothetical protein